MFCLKNEVPNRIRNIPVFDSLNSSRPVNQARLKADLAARKCRVQKKQENLTPELSFIVPENSERFNSQNLSTISIKFLCSICRYILRNSVQLICGHRVCQSCAENCKEDIIRCLECDKETPKNETFIDKAYRKEIEMWETLSSPGDLQGELTNYQDHLDRCHPNSTGQYCSEIFASTDDLNAHQLNECQTIKILLDKIQTLNEDVQRLKNELVSRQNTQDNLARAYAELKFSIQEHNDFLATHQEILQQDLASLKQKIDDRQCVSYDGTLIWKITNVQQKMADARSERQTSIYSPPFYSSPTGYKMCVRLYLYGDGNARRTHMSPFFVLMRGEFDAILMFPFDYKVTFGLFDQTGQQQHIIDSFRPDIKSNSFQRPRSDMNIASGIPKFFPLSMIQQDNNPYIRDDTMFIKVMVDFGKIRRLVLPAALNINPGLPAHVQNDLILKLVDTYWKSRLRRNAEAKRDASQIAQCILDS